MSARTAVVLRLLAALALPATAQPPSKPPEFRTRVAVVYVDAFVTHRGRSVPDLQASHFELRDNGVPQVLQLVAAASRPLSATMVFDTSSSVAGERLAALRAAGEAFLDGLRPADQAGLVAFNEEVVWLAEPTPDKSAVRRALAGLRARGWTAVLDALYSGILLSPGNPRPLVVLFTDGEDNASWLGAADLKLVAERSDVLVHVVAWHPPPAPGASPRVPRAAESAQDRALREIAEASGGRFWTAGSPARLRQVFAAIADAMGHRYVLRYEPAGVPGRGWHRIETRLRGVEGDVHVRSGYWVARE